MGSSSNWARVCAIVTSFALVYFIQTGIYTKEKSIYNGERETAMTYDVHEKFTTESVHTTNTHPTGEGITVPEPDRKFDVPDFLKPELAKALPPEYEDGLLKAWYYFEPMAFMMSKVVPEKIRFDWQKTATNNYATLDSNYRFYIKHLSALLNCTFSDLALEYYLSGAAGKREEKFFNPPLFVHKSGALSKALGDGSSTPFFVQRTCQNYKIRAAKTIRVQHTIALEKFLEKDVWVIHLVRDPRAIMISRKILTGPGVLCSMMAANLKRSLKMQAIGRKIINVRYEDVALYPLESAADIYERLGMEMTPEVMHWIEKNTDPRNPKKRLDNNSNALDLGTTRNSTDAAFHWIRDISLELAEKFDRDASCQYVYKVMNYQNYSITAASPIPALFPNSNRGF